MNFFNPVWVKKDFLFLKSYGFFFRKKQFTTAGNKNTNNRENLKVLQAEQKHDSKTKIYSYSW